MANEEEMKVFDKFTGEQIGSVVVSSPRDVEMAVLAAAEAFASYSKFPAHRRAAILSKTASLIEADKEAIATTICREAGKAWKYSIAEVERGIETFRLSAEEAKRIHGETVPMDASAAGEGRLGFYLRFPIGVVAAITPFNFPPQIQVRYASRSRGSMSMKE